MSAKPELHSANWARVPRPESGRLPEDGPGSSSLVARGKERVPKSSQSIAFTIILMPWAFKGSKPQQQQSGLWPSQGLGGCSQRLKFLFTQRFQGQWGLYPYPNLPSFPSGEAWQSQGKEGGSALSTLSSRLGIRVGSTRQTPCATCSVSPLAIRQETTLWLLCASASSREPSSEVAWLWTAPLPWKLHLPSLPSPSSQSHRGEQRNGGNRG